MMPVHAALASQMASGDEAAAPGRLLDPELLDPGYAQTIADGAIQTGFPPPLAQPDTPEWLRALITAIGRFLQWAAPAGKPLAWVGAALLLLVILYLFVPAFARWIDDLPLRRRRAAPEEEEGVGHAEAGAARALLAEADALAAEGRFAEAAHLLLHRSVEDIESRRPGLVRPAMTSRGLAAAEGLPGAARDAFSRIARAVEISLFGGRPVDAGTWEQCRAAYAELTVPRNWARA